MRLWSFFFLGLIFLSGCQKREGKPADTIFYGGPIITVDQANPIARAIAISDGKIVAIGDEQTVFQWRGFRTNQIDLEGKTLAPGFVEPHSHPMLSAILSSWVDITSFTHETRSEIHRTLKSAIEKAGPGEWILAFGWDTALSQGLAPPTLKELDQLAPENPVFILNQSLHTAYVNSKALELSRVTKETHNPAYGGEYVRDAKGNLTGELKETAIGKVLSHVPAITFAERKNLLKKQYERYLRAGYTTVGGLGLFIPVLDHLRLFEEVQEPPIRIHTFLARFHEDFDTEEIHRLERNLFKIIGIKFWYDGSPYTGTMLLKEPYLVNPFTVDILKIPPGSKGVANYTLPELKDSLLRYHLLKDWQIAIHTEGDQAISDCLQVYEQLLNQHFVSDHRYRLEHCMLFTEEDMKKAHDLGVVPSFHLNHIYYFGEILREKILGPDRAAQMFPLATSLKRGLRISLHCDTPMFPPRPLILMKTAVTRQTRKGAIIGLKEAISVEEALRAVTIDAAWQLFADKEAGSLEPGKSADFVILSESPYEVTQEHLDQIEVLETYVQGKKVFEKNP